MEILRILLHMLVLCSSFAHHICVLTFECVFRVSLCDPSLVPFFTPISDRFSAALKFAVKREEESEDELHHEIDQQIAGKVNSATAKD